MYSVILYRLTHVYYLLIAFMKHSYFIEHVLKMVFQNCLHLTRPRCRFHCLVLKLNIQNQNRFLSEDIFCFVKGELTFGRSN